jgi:hypothetical protein
MRTWQSDVGLTLGSGDRAELLIADLALARALYSGIPAGRLLARMRLASDERDLEVNAASGKAPASSWDALVSRLFDGSAAALERVKRAIARQTRGASDEGPLRVSESCVAALAFALAVSTDPDASPAEILGAGARGDLGEPALARACATYDPRLASAQADRRAVVFEACVRMATRGSAGPWPAEQLMEAIAQLEASELHLTLLRRSSAALFPLAFDAEIADADRRMALLERAELDAVVQKDPRELASALARSDRERTDRDRPDRSRLVSSHLDTLIADLTTLLQRPGELVLAVPPPDLARDEEATPIPSVRPASWVPTDWTSAEAVATLGDAVERGTITVPRLRGIIARGGEPALDAIGAEMLRVGAHPFASVAFAELLAHSGRPRDVIRLVTYFAVAPEPADAARALSACVASELPTVLRAWLEAMLPSDGGLVPFGENPDTSSAARVTACVSALAPYPKLYGAVRPLLARVSEAPPPHSSDGPDV